MNLSFCGCGFLGIYHTGVVSSLVKHGGRFLSRVERVAGASAGSLAAALVVTCPTIHHVKEAKEMTLLLARNIRSKPLGALTPGYQVTSDIDALLHRVLPPDAHKMADGRLYVSLTNVRAVSNEVVSRFKSRDELIEVLLASCHVPVWSGAELPLLQGKFYCDGGLTNNLIRFKEGRTITISPFSGHSDIRPKDPPVWGQRPVYVNLHNQEIQVNLHNAGRFRHAFFPPSSKILQRYFDSGQREGHQFLVREGLYEEEDSSSVVH